ncbi:phosphotransferase enzyme family protein [Micromonospora craniellae]|uniref:Aminoglycoside phosphotransferase family protein n=1 Tax=Micromonospora craniellae TaxID=2294034 RepID=A0A372FRR0_9ACTN|nr:aminoglycoside phosphotransferase family protein [Micromonospora craniellae]QOC94417.1 aminoglycoside phosphotransferase family protein [Micromonospora craniellae]RFS43199.1 aminoglycoside phosphotransferase family protein [Micromonospora craniellae]
MRAEEAINVVRSAATRAGIPAHDAAIVRVGENGVVLLPAAGVLARVVPIRTIGTEFRRETDVAAWLAEQQVPVVRPVRPEPITIGQHVVSLWEYLPDSRPADLVTLAESLRHLHSVPLPTNLLPQLTPFDRFEERLTSGVDLDPNDHALLCQLRDELSTQWALTVFAIGDAVLHGDAHMDNLLVTDSGRIAFVDLETVCIGPPEWDLTLTALYYECGWYSEEDYRRFVLTYGFDVRRSPSWPMLRLIRMLRMTLWLAQSADNDPQRRRQLRHRINTLRDGSAPTGWTGY